MIHTFDCDYKQLKHAESTVEECHKYQAQLEDRIDSLEQQNKELTEKVFLSERNVMNTAATFCEKEEKISKLERENKIIKGMHDSINSRFDKLYQALQEIKDIAQHCYNPVDKENDGFYTIYTKIREVLDEG